MICLQVMKFVHKLPGDSSSYEEENVITDLITTDGTHSFYYFDNIYSPSLKKSIKSKLRKLKNKIILPGKVLDWKILEQLGQKEALQNILSRAIEFHGTIAFHCRAWENVLNVNEEIYIELTREFFATFYVNKSITNYYDERMLTFRLGGGKMRYMSLAEFTIAMGIYTMEQLESFYFDKYMEICEREPPENFDYEEAWEEIGTGKFQANQTKSLLIKDPYLRLIHKMITSSFNMKSYGQDKVNKRDLWLLHQVCNSSRYTDIPYNLAIFLQENNESCVGNSIVGAQYVTRLAKYFSILTPRVLATLNLGPKMGLINLIDMRRMWVAHYSDASRSHTVWGDDRNNNELSQITKFLENTAEKYNFDISELPQSSHQATKKKSKMTDPEINNQEKFYNLNLKIDKLQESMDMILEMQRRCMYDLYRVTQQQGLDSQMVASWYDPNIPAPFEQWPQWNPQELNPPYPTPYDQWIRRQEGN